MLFENVLKKNLYPRACSGDAARQVVRGMWSCCFLEGPPSSEILRLKLKETTTTTNAILYAHFVYHRNRCAMLVAANWIIAVVVTLAAKRVQKQAAAGRSSVRGDNHRTITASTAIAVETRESLSASRAFHMACCAVPSVTTDSSTSTNRIVDKIKTSKPSESIARVFARAILHTELIWRSRRSLRPARACLESNPGDCVSYAP